MKITLLLIGKTSSTEIKSICADYSARVNRYTKLEEVIIESPSSKITDEQKLKGKEGELILKKIAATDFVILLDDKGKEFVSEQFAAQMENLFSQSLKKIVFVIGGAYGFSKDVYARANMKLSLSKMTFTHQMVRAVFLEQLYRAFTIIRNEKNHH